MNIIQNYIKSEIRGTIIYPSLTILEVEYNDEIIERWEGLGIPEEVDFTQSRGSKPLLELPSKNDIPYIIHGPYQLKLSSVKFKD